MSKQVVDHFGLHLSNEGIYWLLQQSGGLNAFGLPEKACPFRIKTHLMMCPHQFNLGVSAIELTSELAEYERRLASSPMLQFFDPATTPTARSIYIETDVMAHFQTVMMLQGLLNPSSACNASASTAKDNVETILKRLANSNLASYMIYNLCSGDQKLITQMAMSSMSIRGRIALVGQKLPLGNLGSACTKLEFEPSTHAFVHRMGALKMNKLGALRLKNFMRS